MKTFLPLLLMALLFSCNSKKNNIENIGEATTDSLSAGETTALKIAKANGLDVWKNVSEIKFTFNVNSGENHFYRSWIWKPERGDVTMMTAKDTVNYNRSKLDSITKNTDAAFINDKYWLLAPFQLAWDEGTTFSEKENVLAPISGDTLHQLTVVYGNEGGYTPGDAYDFFYDKNYKVKEWNYRQGNAPTPTKSTTWEDYKDENGLEIATMHRDSTNTFKLYFTDISVKKE